MSSREIPITRFLNIDLDLSSRDSLDELFKVLEPTIFVLNKTPRGATVELNRFYKTPEKTAVQLVALIQKLPPKTRAIWNRCRRRIINIGIQAGQEPYQTQFTLSAKTVGLLASISCENTFTVYVFKNDPFVHPKSGGSKGRGPLNRARS